MWNWCVKSTKHYAKNWNKTAAFFTFTKGIFDWKLKYSCIISWVTDAPWCSGFLCTVILHQSKLVSSSNFGQSVSSLDTFWTELKPSFGREFLVLWSRLDITWRLLTCSILPRNIIIIIVIITKIIIIIFRVTFHFTNRPVYPAILQPLTLQMPNMSLIFQFADIFNCCFTGKLRYLQSDTVPFLYILQNFSNHLLAEYLGVTKFTTKIKYLNTR